MSPLTDCLLQVDTDLTLSALSDAAFQSQITRDLILEDTLHFLLPPHTHLDTHLSSETHQVTSALRQNSS